MQTQTEKECFILTVRELHLGFVKETFRAGAVIVHDIERRQLIIDGRRFEDTRDLDILKRQAARKPDNPWIIPYSDEAMARFRAVRPEPSRKPERAKVPIVQHDTDDHEPIDIRDTQVGKRKMEAAEAERANRKTGGEMPIIRGDENVEDRLARLAAAKNTDLSAAAERVRLKGAAPAKMPIVQDDSLGYAGGSKAAARNAGQIFSGKRAEEASETVISAAQARKQEAERNRQRVLANEGLTGMDVEVGPIIGVVPTPEPPEQTPASLDSKDIELARLRAQLQAEQTPEPAPDPRDAEIAKLRAELAAAKAKKAGPVRVPVTDEATAQEILGATEEEA